jgi:hypothetical protein
MMKCNKNTIKFDEKETFGKESLSPLKAMSGRNCLSSHGILKLLPTSCRASIKIFLQIWEMLTSEKKSDNEKPVIRVEIDEENDRPKRERTLH